MVQNENQLILLKSTNNKYEIDLITVTLKENDIPYIIKNKTIDGHMKLVTGNFFDYIEIYIKEKDFDKVQELLDQFTTI